METTIHGEDRIGWVPKEYMGSLVYGGIDGAVTTFAVVAGATGANLDISVILILGFANLVADGFSMSVGSYFSTKTEKEQYQKHYEKEVWEIMNLREKEVQEIREIYAKKGFQGELLEQVVHVITSDEQVWLDTMMKEELEMTTDTKTPISSALATFISFNVIGFIPLASYFFAKLFSMDNENLFLISCLSTALGLGIVGYMKSLVTEQKTHVSIIETLVLGGLAASLAYFVGNFLEQLFL